MGPLGSLFVPLGVFLVLVGAVLVSRSPFMKEIWEQSDFLQRHRKSMGTVFMVVGVVLIAVEIVSGA